MDACPHFVSGIVCPLEKRGLQGSLTGRGPASPRRRRGPCLDQALSQSPRGPSRNEAQTRLVPVRSAGVCDGLTRRARTQSCDPWIEPTGPGSSDQGHDEMGGNGRRGFARFVRFCCSQKSPLPSAERCAGYPVILVCTSQLLENQTVLSVDCFSSNTNAYEYTRA